MKKWTLLGPIAVALMSNLSIALAEEKPRVVVIPLFDERTGNAVEEDVLSGVTFSNADATGLTGAMPYHDAVNLTPGTTAQFIPEGYHDGTGLVSGDVDLTAGNIKSGVELFGIAGTLVEASGDAVASQVLSGQTFSTANAIGLTGTMSDNGAVNLTPGTTAQSIPEGYHNGTGTVAGDTDLSAGNVRSGVAIFGVTGNLIEASGDAATGEVLAGRVFSKAGASGLIGTMPDNEGDNASTAQSAESSLVKLTAPSGFYDGDDTVTASDGEIAALDSDISESNIRKDVSIFGVTGSMVALQVLSTGQTTSYATGDDGDLQKGASRPTPRFIDNGDGTVTDNLTTLVWLKDCECPGMRAKWAPALESANSLFDGGDGDESGGDCGLSDGSVAGDWRLPNINELLSLVDWGEYNSSLPAGHPFVGGENLGASPCWTTYWSSTAATNPSTGPDTKAAVSIVQANLRLQGATTAVYGFWPVRDPQ